MKEEKISYPNTMHQLYSSLSSRHWWFLSRCKLIQFVLSQTHLVNQHNISYLEVGCGTGMVLDYVQKSNPNWLCLGLEGQAEAIKIAEISYPSIKIKQQDLNHFAVIESYDCIGCFDVIEHITHDLPVLESLRFSLKPGGCLILTVPQHPWLWSNADVFAGHKRRYTRQNLLSQLNKAGFHVDYVSSFVCLLVPLMALQRLFRTRYRSQYDPIAELTPHHLLNKLLIYIMNAERFLMKLKLSFPIGGSLVVRASKK